MKMYGDNLLILEEISLTVLEDLFEDWRNRNGRPFDPETEIRHTVAKIISSLCFKKYFTHEQVLVIDQIARKLAYATGAGGHGHTLEFMPWLRHFGHKTWQVIKDHCTLENELYEPAMLDRLVRYLSNYSTC